MGMSEGGPNGMAEMGERMAVVESRIDRSCRDIDELHESNRSHLQKLDLIDKKVTEIDTHLNNGIGMKIAKTVTSYMKWVLGLFAVIEVLSLVSMYIRNGGQFGQ